MDNKIKNTTDHRASNGVSKNLFLIFHGRFPSEKAASLFTAKGAEAFAREGINVTVVVPRRKKVGLNNPFAFYNVEKNFEVKYIATLDLFYILPNKIAFWLSFVIFSIFSCIYIIRKSKKEDIAYSNESLPLFLVSFFRKKCFFEMHDFPQSKLGLYSKFLSRMHWVLIHNRWKLNEAQKKFPNISQNKFIYEPNAVDINAFDIDISKIEARKKIGLDINKVIAVYTGHLYGWKGVDILAKASELLSENYLVVFVGGTKNDIDEFRKKYGTSKRIFIAGHKSHKEIPFWQKAADVLVLPNTAKEAISAYYTSPMKLFEYMASKRPIVASDIPSIREIISEKNAVLVSADNPFLLARAIEEIINDLNRGDSIARQAFQDVSEHTWEKRAKRILDFIEKV